MALQTKNLTFRKPTSPSDQTISWANGGNWLSNATPKAIIFYTVGQLTNNSFNDNQAAAYGIASGTGADNQRCIATTSTNGGAGGTTDEDTWITDRAIAIVRNNNIFGVTTIISEGELIALADNSFTLRWATRASQNFGVNDEIIHALVLGGDTITNAQVASWVMSAGPGNSSLTSLAFQPDVVFHLGTLSSPLATNLNGIVYTLGWMNCKNQQGTIGISAEDAVTTSNTLRVQFDHRCLAIPTLAGTLGNNASFVSMNSNGFTVFNHSTAGLGNIFSLCLKGPASTIGSFDKTTVATGNQTVGSLGTSSVKSLMLASFQDITQALVVEEARLGLGTYDGTNDTSMAFQIRDNVVGAPFTFANCIDRDDRVFLKYNDIDANTDAEANGVSLGTDDFTIDWNPNDGAATELLYCVFGEGPPCGAVAASYGWTWAGEIMVMGPRA